MMETKRFIVSLGCFVLVLFGTVAYAENIPVKNKWREELGERSLSSCPSLIKEGSTLFILSDRVLDNLSIAITTEDGQQICLELTDVTVDMEYVLPVDMLPVGNYYITVMQGMNYVIGYFHVN
ncbi:DUF3244 domain-containing protein [Phocaeicola sp.]